MIGDDDCDDYYDYGDIKLLNIKKTSDNTYGSLCGACGSCCGYMRDNCTSDTSCCLNWHPHYKTSVKYKLTYDGSYKNTTYIHIL